MIWVIQCPSEVKVPKGVLPVLFVCLFARVCVCVYVCVECVYVCVCVFFCFSATSSGMLQAGPLLGGYGVGGRTYPLGKIYSRKCLLLNFQVMFSVLQGCASL